jgi:hypothetical protein
MTLYAKGLEEIRKVAFAADGTPYYGLWIVAMLLILSAAWMHYEVLLIIPFFQAFVLAHKADRFARPAAACYALAWMLFAPAPCGRSSIRRSTARSGS